MARGLGAAILVIAVAALSLFTSAQTTHIVGDSLGWLVPPGGPATYKVWAVSQTFTVGDILVFNFSDGDQDVAEVTKEAFKTCNSTDPISLKTKSPANFTLDQIGEYYFIGTKDKHCILGQKLAINVTRYPGPTAYIVGDGLGWFVPPGGPLFYKTWAHKKSFKVGDTLVFNFINGTQDVAVVTESVFKNCTKNDTIALYTTSPANITLKTAGEQFFTSTYDSHCELGQKLAINVTTATPSSGPAKPPSSSSSPSTFGPTAGGPAAPPFQSSAPSRIAAGYLLAPLLIAMAFFH